MLVRRPRAQFLAAQQMLALLENWSYEVNLLNMSIAQAGEAMVKGHTSSEELTRACLNRISRTDSVINAFITVDEKSALAAARKADSQRRAGALVSPLHGVPIAVKDNVDTCDIRTTRGSSIFRAHRPHEDAVVVERLRAAGAVILGKTNLHEFAWGGTTENRFFGVTRNPWDTDRNSGGSSGGSAAAVAAYQCFMAVGTDTGGSIRNPAAATGITGLRPSLNKISTAGVFPLAWSMDTVGPMARTAQDVAIAYGVMVGSAPTMGWGRKASLRRRRIGVVPEFALGAVDDDVRHGMEMAIAQFSELGAEIVHVEMGDLREYYPAFLLIHTVEPSFIHRRLLREYANEYGEDVRGQLEAGLTVSAADYILALRYRDDLRARFFDAFKGIDVMITPTSPTPATLIGEDPRELALRRGIVDRRRTFFTGLASLLGFPALSLPIGLSDGMPIGMDLTGAPSSEAQLLDIGIAFQAGSRVALAPPDLL